MVTSLKLLIRNDIGIIFKKLITHILLYVMCLIFFIWMGEYPLLSLCFILCMPPILEVWNLRFGLDCLDAAYLIPTSLSYCKKLNILWLDAILSPRIVPLILLLGCNIYFGAPMLHYIVSAIVYCTEILIFMVIAQFARRRAWVSVACKQSAFLPFFVFYITILFNVFPLSLNDLYTANIAYITLFVLLISALSYLLILLIFRRLYSTCPFIDKHVVEQFNKNYWY